MMRLWELLWVFTEFAGINVALYRPALVLLRPRSGTRECELKALPFKFLFFLSTAYRTLPPPTCSSSFHVCVLHIILDERLGIFETHIKRNER